MLSGSARLLADDMGLGKTLQLLALLAHEKSETATLLVCPMSVVGNWQREAARFVPSLRVYVHHGSDRATGAELEQAVRDSDLVITTYALMTRDVAALKDLDWRRVVLDEAQHIKNAKTSQARAARSIPADHRVALTGTPVENRLDELRSILDFANRGVLGSEQMFRKTVCRTDRAGKRSTCRLETASRHVTLCAATGQDRSRRDRGSPGEAGDDGSSESQ